MVKFHHEKGEVRGVSDTTLSLLIVSITVYVETRKQLNRDSDIFQVIWKKSRRDVRKFRMASGSEWTTCWSMNFSTDWWAKFRLLTPASWLLQGQDTLALLSKHCTGHTLLLAATTFPLPPETAAWAHLRQHEISLLKFKLKRGYPYPAGEGGPSPSPTSLLPGNDVPFLQLHPCPQLCKSLQERVPAATWASRTAQEQTVPDAKLLAG